MSKKYQLIERFVDAVQWMGENQAELLDFVEGSNNEHLINAIENAKPNEKITWPHLIEREMKCGVGDWICTDSSKEFWVIQKDSFARRFEVVE